MRGFPLICRNFTYHSYLTLRLLIAGKLTQRGAVSQAAQSRATISRDVVLYMHLDEPQRRLQSGRCR